jgi:glycerol-3-phosphate dehydrogenase
MKRNVSVLADKQYDVIIVGGGIFGICAARDAALRGLSVALLEKGDFGHATSASHFKMVHGGIRYLQHADIYRIRESSQERSTFLRTAPHLVRPLPIVIPTYRHGMKGKEVMRMALSIYDLLTFDRNRGIRDPQLQIPPGRIISKRECLELFPHLDQKGLNGGALFHDGQMYNPPRLSLAYLQSAVEAGAEAVNYVEVIDFMQESDHIIGVKARHNLSGESFEIRGRVVINAAGPWAKWLLKLQTGLRLNPEPTFSRDAYFIVPRRLMGDYALATQGRTRDPDAILSRGNRHLFIVPWRDYTLIGVWHLVFQGPPDKFTVTEEDLQGFLDEINASYPSLDLTLQDVSLWNAGLTLFGENKDGATHLSYGKRSIIVDHAEKHNLAGLITMIGVRYTTATGVAKKAIDLAFEKLERRPLQSIAANTPVYGGDIECFHEFLQHAIKHRPANLSAEVMSGLVHNYGSNYTKLLKYVEHKPQLAQTLGISTVIKAEVIHAIREEMALRLADVVFRRTDLGTAGHPGSAALMTCAELMGSELGWDQTRLRIEINEVERRFPEFLSGQQSRRPQAQPEISNEQALLNL